MKKNQLQGKRFGRLLVLQLIPNLKPGPLKWQCICDCGKYCNVFGSNLKAGTSNSCGCLAKENKHLIKHGRTNTTEYNIWDGIKARCFNSKDKAYPKYGGRGIKMCDEWKNSFEQFFKDMGMRPNKLLTIERRDNNIGYCKSNCYWGTKKEQSDNRSYTVWLEYEGVRLPQVDWARKLGVTPSSIAYRLKKGQSFSEIYKHFSLLKKSLK